ncbi:hypothetical protein ACIQWR_38605 [Streptomyces sp. NPDC098789]
MDQIRDQGGTSLLAYHLARLGANTTWKDGPSFTTVAAAWTRPCPPR